MQQYFTSEYYEQAMSQGLSGWWRRSHIKSQEQKRLDKLVAQAMRRSLTSEIERAFERTDAYVWLLKAQADRSVTQELSRIESAVRDAIGRKNYEYTVAVYPDPLRVELQKSPPDKVRLTSLNRRKISQDAYHFAPGIRQRVSDHVPHIMSLTDPEVAQMLVAGATGSGKTLLAISILVTLAQLNSPSKLSLLVIDPKQVDIGNTDLQRLPHLAHPIITDPALGVSAIYRLATEMKSRLAAIGQCTAKRQRWVMPGRIFCYVDEMQELLENDSQVVDVLAWIAQQGRGLGIHLCLATQRPTVDVVKGHLRSNLPCRFGGWVRGADDARIVTGLPESGLENLLGSGMFKVYTRSQGISLQGYYTDDADLGVLVDEIVKSQRENPCWSIESLSATEDVPEEVLELVEEAAQAPAEERIMSQVVERMKGGEQITLTKLDEIRKAVEGKGYNRKDGKAVLERAKEMMTNG